MRRAALFLSLTCVLAALTGCADTAGRAASAPPASSAPSPEDDFINALLSTPGLTRTVPRQQVIGVGRFVCEAIGAPGVSRTELVEGLGTSKWGPAVAPVIVDLSHQHLCPGNVYAEPSFSGTSTVAPPDRMVTVPDLVGLTGDEASDALNDAGALDVMYAQNNAPMTNRVVSQSPAPGTRQRAGEEVYVELEPPGPLVEFGAGTWEVGVDVVAGKYKTLGSDNCYWARLRNNDGSTDDIIDNNIGAGPQTVTIKDGEYFETQRCGTWTRQ